MATRHFILVANVRPQDAEREGAWGADGVYRLLDALRSTVDEAVGITGSTSLVELDDLDAELVWAMEVASFDADTDRREYARQLAARDIARYSLERAGFPEPEPALKASQP